MNHLLPATRYDIPTKRAMAAEAIFKANRVAVMTARPGRIKSDIAIDLPHPRHYTIKTSAEFSAYKAWLTEEIRVESIRAAEMGT
jgi:ABC-type nitrate/sulfonate/bicarbonate transport system ATPase subunit